MVWVDFMLIIESIEKVIQSQTMWSSKGETTLCLASLNGRKTLTTLTNGSISSNSLITYTVL